MFDQEVTRRVSVVLENKKKKTAFLLVKFFLLRGIEACPAPCDDVVVVVVVFAMLGVSVSS